MPLEYFYSIDAPYVKVLSLPHILFLVVCALTVWFFVRSRKAVRLHRQAVSNVFLGIILFQQIFLMYGWYLLVTDDLLSQALPLELCRVSSLLTICFLISKNNKFMDVIFYFSIYAICSLVYPKNVYHFAHVNGISFMINHLMTVLTPIFGVIAYDWRPTWKSFRRAAISFTVYLPVVVVVDALTGGNYFYLIDRPLLQNMPAVWYIPLAYGVTIGGFALVTWGLSFLPEKKTAAVQ